MFSANLNKEENLWRGLDIPPLYHPQISIAQVVLNAMTTFGSKVAQISDDSGISFDFNELKTKTIRAAKNLQTLGYKPKQVFTLIARNSHHVAPIVFASFAIGCPMNSLDVSFGRTEIIHMLSITKPVAIFCDLDCYETLCKCLDDLKINAQIFTFGGTVGQSESVESLFEVVDNENQFIPVKVDGQNDTVLIVCSSGTTGLPKGVCLSHAALLDNVSRVTLFNSNDVFFCFSSPYWLSGIMTLMWGTLNGALRIITTETFSPELQLRLIEQYKVTYTLNAPHHIVLMMKCDHFHHTDISSLKYLFVGGSKVPFHLKSELGKYIPNGNVIFCYGMSELSGIIFYDYPTTVQKNSVGRILSGCCVKIIDENGKRCGINTEGEICIKPTYKFLGYLSNQTTTDELFDEEGFVKSGDLGYFDGDGDFYHVGRKKELIKYGNMQISPSEIDSYLTHSSDIKAACVVGIHDIAMGDLPAAVIVRADKSNISERHIYDMVSDHFADHYKLRGGIYFVDSLPATPSGKVQRNKVAEIAIELFNTRESTESV